MRFFWVGHFEFSKSAILNFFLLHLCEKSSPFIWGIIFFCTMDGFFRILKKTSFQLFCTRLYLKFFDFFQLFSSSCWTFWRSLCAVNSKKKFSQEWVGEIFNAENIIYGMQVIVYYYFSVSKICKEIRDCVLHLQIYDFTIIIHNSADVWFSEKVLTGKIEICILVIKTIFPFGILSQ